VERPEQTCGLIQRFFARATAMGASGRGRVAAWPADARAA
jgi:hypothetical protein